MKEARRPLSVKSRPSRLSGSDASWPRKPGSVGSTARKKSRLFRFARSFSRRVSRSVRFEIEPPGRKSDHGGALWISTISPDWPARRNASSYASPEPSMGKELTPITKGRGSPRLILVGAGSTSLPPRQAMGSARKPAAAPRSLLRLRGRFTCGTAASYYYRRFA